VDARVPILRRELKEDACAHADGYFRLGHTDTGKAAARKLLDKLAYIYTLKFDVRSLPLPVLLTLLRLYRSIMRLRPLERSPTRVNSLYS
jgi:hypothetical protein